MGEEERKRRSDKEEEEEKEIYAGVGWMQTRKFPNPRITRC
jgi:hypothetical protein